MDPYSSPNLVNFISTPSSPGTNNKSVSCAPVRLCAEGQRVVYVLRRSSVVRSIAYDHDLRFVR